MALVILSCADVYRHLRPEEIEGYALPEGETLDSVTTQFIVETTDKVASYVNAAGECPILMMGTGALPAECKSAALAIIRYSILALIGGDSAASDLVGSTRRAEYDQANQFLDKVASAQVSVSYTATQGLTSSSAGMMYGSPIESEAWGAL